LFDITQFRTSDHVDGGLADNLFARRIVNGFLGLDAREERTWGLVNQLDSGTYPGID
jgi:hypothetical protein